MVQIASLRYLVTPYCPNVPDHVFEMAFLECARDYFNRTHAWNQTGTIQTILNEPNYIIEPSDKNNESIMQVNSVFDESINDFSKFISNGSNKIKLAQAPINIKPLIVSVVVRPKIGALEINDEILEENEKGLRLGTVFKLKSQTQTDWFDPQLTPMFEKDYEFAISDKKLEIANQFNNKSFDVATSI